MGAFGAATACKTLRLAGMKRIMSIDYGTKWVGIAITDAERKVALPFDVLEYRGDDELVEWLEKFVSEWDVGTIVLGLPIHLSGDESQMSQRVRMIADKIKKRISVSVDLWDERLTSKEAARVISELGKKSKDYEKVLNKISATLILQSYLEAKRGRERNYDEREV